MKKIFLALGCLVFLTLSATASGTKKSQNTFATPDFAYPATVAKHAGAELERALRSGNDGNLIKAVIQLTMAENMIDRTRAVSMARRIDSLASISAPVTASILYSLEADLYNQIYQSDRWKYSQRNLPADNIPADPALWDKTMFGSRISELVWQSLSHATQLLTTDVGDYSRLLGKMSDVSKEYYPSMYQVLLSRGIEYVNDFMTFRNIIPFRAEMTEQPQGEKIAELMRCHADSAVNYFYKHGENLPAAASVVMRSRLETSPIPYLLKWADTFAGNEAEGIILNALIATSYPDNKQSTSNFINRASEYVRRYPSSAFTPALEQDIMSRVRPMVSMSMQERQMTYDSIEIKVALRNTPEMFMLVYKINNSKQQPRKLADAIAGLVPVSSIKLSAVANDTLIIKYPPLQQGTYICVPARDKSGIQLFEEYMEGSPYQGRFNVGNTVYISTSSPEGQCAIVVADGKGLSPLQGAEVSLSSYRKNSEALLLKTGSDGLATYIDSIHRFTKGQITYRGEKIEFSPARAYAPNEKVREVKKMSLFTDRALYRPADTLRFVGIGYSGDMSSGNMSPLENNEVRIDLYDAKYQIVDSLSFTTDIYGRITGEFRLPTRGMLGRYSLREPNTGANVSFEVAEYKLPTFYVEIDSVKCGAINSDLTFSGRVMTYSGMPLSRADVRYDIECMQSYWRNTMAWCYDSSGATYGAQTQTDTEGRFSIVLPLSGLSGTPYENALFQLKVSATSQAGETQTAPVRRFYSGETLNINAEIPELIKKTASDYTYAIKVTDLLGKPVELHVNYRLLNVDGQILSSGVAAENKFVLSCKLIPGKYKVVFNVAESEDVACVKEFILYDPKSDIPPIETALWLPEKKVKTAPGAQYVKAKALTSYPESWMMYEVSDGRNVLARQMLRANGNVVEAEWSAPRGDERIYITFYACHNLDVTSSTLTFEPEKIDNSLIVSVESFRDKVSASSTEHWKFKFKNRSEDTGIISAFATVTNAAMDALVPFEWTFSPRITVPRYMSASVHSYIMTTYHSGWLTQYKRQERILPHVADIYTYGQKLFGGSTLRIRGNGAVYYTTSTKNYLDGSAVAGDMKMAKAEAVEEAADDLASGAIEEEGNVENSERLLRPAEMPIALFAPLLQSDAEGILALEFDVPDYNTTWRLQLIGYDNCMHTAKINERIEASKPVMVQSSLPRFLRTGDMAEVSATMFNALDYATELTGRIEICDTKNGQPIREPFITRQNIEAGGSYVMTMPLAVREAEGAYLVKVYACAGDFSDGEQGLVAILPSSEPVFEGQPIYMSPDEREYVCKLNEYPAGASVTLSFCSNPIWTVLNALYPLSREKSASILSKADAMFSNALSAALLKKYPLLRDSVSMTSCGQEELAEILSLQNADGGWSWCPGMRSSDYITGKVLEVLSSLKRLNALPDTDGVEAAINSAVGYCDAILAETYRNAGKNFNALSAMDYLLVRKETGAPENSVINTIKKMAVADAEKQWRKMDIENAASAAKLLKWCGRQSVALQVLESLEQRSVYSPEKGRRFENLIGKYASLYVTMRVLETYTDVLPRDKHIIDQLRQWILLQKQTEDWSTIGFVPELVYTLLTTGSDWVADAEPPVVEIGGVKIETGDSKKYSGEVTIKFSGEELSGKELRITNKSLSPAWGGIASVKILPIKEVKAAGNDELRIEKRVCRVVSGDDGEKIAEGRIYKGDKVRVFLTVTAKRNIDYVEITDSRAACLEPVRQISSYTSTDGLWYFIETRNTSTNLYIGSLPKGSFVLTYDCYATRDGDYASGIANIQSIYAPVFAGHSAGSEMKVVK